MNENLKLSDKQEDFLGSFSKTSDYKVLKKFLNSIICEREEKIRKLLKERKGDEAVIEYGKIEGILMIMEKIEFFQEVTEEKIRKIDVIEEDIF